MATKAELSDDGCVLTLHVSGRFDFSQHKQFRESYRDHSSEINYIVDLAKTDYIDSSALGMLLLLREHAGSKDGHVILQGGGAEVIKVLELSNFNRLFKVS